MYTSVFLVSHIPGDTRTNLLAHKIPFSSGHADSSVEKYKSA